MDPFLARVTSPTTLLSSRVMVLQMCTSLYRTCYIFRSLSLSVCHCCTMRSVLFRLRDTPLECRELADPLLSRELIGTNLLLRGRGTDGPTCMYRWCHSFIFALCLCSHLGGGCGAAPFRWGVPNGIFCAAVWTFQYLLCHCVCSAPCVVLPGCGDAPYWWGVPKGIRCTAVGFLLY